MPSLDHLLTIVGKTLSTLAKERPGIFGLGRRDLEIPKPERSSELDQLARRYSTEAEPLSLSPVITHKQAYGSMMSGRPAKPAQWVIRATNALRNTQPIQLGDRVIHPPVKPAAMDLTDNLDAMRRSTQELMETFGEPELRRNWLSHSDEAEQAAALRGTYDIDASEASAPGHSGVGIQMYYPLWDLVDLLGGRNTTISLTSDNQLRKKLALQSYGLRGNDMSHVATSHDFWQGVTDSPEGQALYDYIYSGRNKPVWDDRKTGDQNFTRLTPDQQIGALTLASRDDVAKRLGNSTAYIEPGKPPMPFNKTEWPLDRPIWDDTISPMLSNAENRLLGERFKVGPTSRRRAGFEDWLIRRTMNGMPVDPNTLVEAAKLQPGFFDGLYYADGGLVKPMRPVDKPWDIPPLLTNPNLRHQGTKRTPRDLRDRIISTPFLDEVLGNFPHDFKSLDGDVYYPEDVPRIPIFDPSMMRNQLNMAGGGSVTKLVGALRQLMTKSAPEKALEVEKLMNRELTDLPVPVQRSQPEAVDQGRRNFLKRAGAGAARAATRSVVPDAVMSPLAQFAARQVAKPLAEEVMAKEEAPAGLQWLSQVFHDMWHDPEQHPARSFLDTDIPNVVNTVNALEKSVPGAFKEFLPRIKELEDFGHSVGLGTDNIDYEKLWDIPENHSATLDDIVPLIQEHAHKIKYEHLKDSGLDQDAVRYLTGALGWSDAYDNAHHMNPGFIEEVAKHYPEHFKDLDVDAP